ncbi:MAG TPA: GtrA family protein [Stellaceae bacterium]|nr:GtrA family protein [Stellaceae bacterium]
MASTRSRAPLAAAPAAGGWPASPAAAAAPCHGWKSGAALVARLLSFSLVGAAATGVQYLVLALLVRGFAMEPVLASGLGFSLSAALNYALNYRFTFRSRKRHCEAAAKFAALALMGLLWNSLVMAVAIRAFGLSYLTAQLAATATVLAWNFIGSELWAFRARA